jgi:asparagine synthase (glutamine-hydrolysing)
MCGICGFVKFDEMISSGDALTIARMNSRLLHRGPDDQGMLLLEHHAFGFTRLSIIGLSNGMQPIYSEDENIVLVCNGEIFNYIELREELKKKRHVFRTESDVEVIIHLYEDFGIDRLLSMLNGQFAFVLYDKKKNILFCARDQMGIIPLFYTVANRTFIFASEIKAILEHPFVKREVDLIGLDQVFTFAGLISPRTMFKHIYSLENGHYLIVRNNGEMADKEYWDLIYPEGEISMNGRSEREYVDELEELFENSIRLRLRSHAPSGFYLSGGLDSSMILMKAGQLMPGICKEAFSIDFVGSDLSESFYQKLISEASNSRLNQRVFLSSDIADRLDYSVYHSECPIKETYNTASLSLSETVREKGIKVILSGEGADELFAGYVGYRFDKMRAINAVNNKGSTKEDEMRYRLWGDESFFYERNYLDFGLEKKSFYSAALNDSFDEISCLNHFVINKDRLKNRSLLNKRAYVDYKLRLVDHLVSDHGDRMAMANSVEVRYPFLDKDLVDFSTRVPCELKLNDLTEKYILRKMAERFVPEAVCDREKFHFVAPGSPELIQKNTEYVNDLLSYNVIKRQGFFNPDKIERLKATYKQPGFSINAPFENDLLITVITFGMLLNNFFE